MTNEQKIKDLEKRIELLRSRNTNNGNIIRKLERKIRILKGDTE